MWEQERQQSSQFNSCFNNSQLTTAFHWTVISRSWSTSAHNGRSQKGKRQMLIPIWMLCFMSEVFFYLKVHQPLQEAAHSSSHAPLCAEWQWTKSSMDNLSNPLIFVPFHAFMPTRQAYAWSVEHWSFSFGRWTYMCNSIWCQSQRMMVIVITTSMMRSGRCTGGLL